MKDNILTKLFEHNNWANLQIIEACSTFGDEQFDAEPQSVTKGSIRSTLSYLINSQEDYLSQLVSIEARFDWQEPPDFEEVERATMSTREGLIALAQEATSKSLKTKFQKDGYSIEPWVVLVQTINHATEHREQIKSMLIILGITPPRVDGWAYGRMSEALIQLPT